MSDRYRSANPPTAELAAAWVDHPDTEVMRALVTVGAFVALAGASLENGRSGASRTR